MSTYEYTDLDSDVELYPMECDCEVSCFLSADDFARFMTRLEELSVGDTEEIIEVITALTGPHTDPGAVAALCASIPGLDSF